MLTFFILKSILLIIFYILYLEKYNIHEISNNLKRINKTS